MRLRQFTHDASHELRTPLAAVGSSLDLALKTGDYEREIRAAKRRTEARLAAHRAAAAIGGTRRVGSCRRRPTDMSALVASEVEQHRQAAADAGIELTSTRLPRGWSWTATRGW